MVYQRGNLRIDYAHVKQIPQIASLLRRTELEVKEDFLQFGDKFIATDGGQLVGYSGIKLEGVKAGSEGLLPLLRAAKAHDLEDPSIGGCDK